MVNYLNNRSSREMPGRMASCMIFILISGMVPLLVLNIPEALAQEAGVPRSRQFRLGERIVRIAEPGQLTDTVNVWGDVNSPGRYLIPRHTALPELISYTMGPSTLRNRNTTLDWSRLRVEVNVSEYEPGSGIESIRRFRFRYSEPLPEGIRTFDLKNNSVVSLEVKRRPAFIDYVSVAAPVISGVATTILIVERLR